MLSNQMDLRPTSPITYIYTLFYLFLVLVNHTTMFNKVILNIILYTYNVFTFVDYVMVLLIGNWTVCDYSPHVLAILLFAVSCSSPSPSSLCTPHFVE